MAADTIIIDISARFTDDTASGMGRARNNADRLGDSIRRTQDQADRFGRTRAQADLSVRDRATSTVSRVSDSLRSIGGKTFSFTVKALDFATAPLRSILGYATSFKGIVTGIVAGQAFNKLVRGPTALADTLEGSKMFFERKLGGPEEAQKFLNEIYKFDEKSPFNTMQIIDTVKSMMGVGWSRDNVLKDIGTIGDASSSLGLGTDGVQSIARQLGQMKMKMKVSQEEINVLNERGIDAWKYIADSMGTTIEKARQVNESKSGIKGTEAVNAIIAGLEKEYGGASVDSADRMVGGIWGQITSLLQTKVYLPLGEGLSEGTKKGLGVMKDLLEKNETKIVKLGETLKKVGSNLSNAFFGKLEDGYKRLDKALGSVEFNNADLAGKMKIIWKEVVSEPFSEWWQSNGGFFTQKGQEIAGGIGNGMGSFFKGGIMTFMGMDSTNSEDFVSSGMKVGRAFADGFMQGFDSDTVAKAIMAGVKNTAIEASKLLPGGEKAGAGSLLSAGLLFYGGKKLGLGKLFGMAKGLKGGAAGEVAETVVKGATKGAGVAEATSVATKAGATVLKGSRHADDYAEWWAKQNLYKMTTGGAATAAHQAKFKGMQMPKFGGKFTGFIDDIATGLLKPASKLATFAPGIGKAGKFLKGNALSLLFAGAAIAQADDKVGETAKQAGGFAASLAGGKAGAMTGAAIGSIVGPAGTAVGGAIGGVVGGIGGYMAGEKASSWLYDKFKKPGEAGENASKKVDNMSYRVDETALRLATMQGQIDPVTSQLLIFSNRLGEVNDRLSNVGIQMPTYAMGPMYTAAKTTITPPKLNMGGGIDRDGNPFTPFATGGIVKSRTKAIIGEGGPEAIIPLTNKRRGRSLLQKAGESLGVSTQQTPSINLGGINISVSGGNGTEVMEAIRAQMPDVANELCEYIATALGRSFGNMATGEV